MFNVREFGAVGDGVVDDTAALQRALDAAGACKGTVYLPEGTYRCGTLRVPAQTGMVGDPVWTYKQFGGAVLQLADDTASCLLDITGSLGVTINGLCLDGQQLGAGIHGIMADNPTHNPEEDAIRIERCRISKFTGHGVYLRHIWVFTLRHNIVSHNQGDGLCCDNMWDGFLLDNWFSANVKVGVRLDWGAACTMTGNRVEWNRVAGVLICGCHHVNMANNYIDRAGGPGIEVCLRPPHYPSYSISLTGNLINRCGSPRWGEPEGYRSCQMLLDAVEGLSCTGNVLHTGQDDGGKGEFSPRFGIVCHALTDAVIANNSLFQGAMEQTLVDLGEHRGAVVLEPNVGSLFVKPTAP